LQLIVTGSNGLNLEDRVYAIPHVSSVFPLQQIPPVLMASLSRAFTDYPVFEDAVFRLDGLCPSSDEAKRTWLGSVAVI
jgi:hypothetical protein